MTFSNPAAAKSNTTETWNVFQRMVYCHMSFWGSTVTHVEFVGLSSGIYTVQVSGSRLLHRLIDKVGYGLDSVSPVFDPHRNVSLGRRSILLFSKKYKN